jgi:hypothetical protein
MARENLPDWSRLWDDFVQEELRDEELNGGRYKNDDENVALARQANKGNFKKFSNGESTSQDDKKKDLNKFKCYACRKFRNYASQCWNKKKDENETQPEVVASVKVQADEFAKNFEKKFLLVSHISSGPILVGAWLLDSGATCHMTRARELFKSFTESNSYMHVELGMDTIHVVKGSRTLSFWIESRGMLRVMDVLWEPELKKSALSVSGIEKNDFDVLFHDGKAQIKPRGSSSDTTIALGVRESNLYRIKG